MFGFVITPEWLNNGGKLFIPHFLDNTIMNSNGPDKKKKKRKGDEWEIDEGSDYPVHEKYTKEEPVKE